MRSLTVPKISDLDRYIKNPELVTTEALFLVLTLSNVFVLFQLLDNVIPFPIFVTWWQLMQGLVMAKVLGECGKEFPKLAYFPPVEIDQNLLRTLFIPTLSYCAMLVLANVVLSKIQSPATFPVVASITVVLHHIARFVGCGEEYMPMRWKSILLLTIAFLIGTSDSKTVGLAVLPYALCYAAAAAAFRAGYLQRIMHLVQGKGNTLHNHQHAIGILILPVLLVIAGEWKVLFHLPYDFFSLRSWQLWGCLATVGALPFLKNVVSNRLIRKTGQNPWRFLEILSIILVFLIGLSFGAPAWQGFLATILVVCGRAVGAVDVITNAEEVDMQLLEEANHRPKAGAEQPENKMALLSSYTPEQQEESASVVYEGEA